MFYVINKEKIIAYVVTVFTIVVNINIQKITFYVDKPKKK